MNTMTIHFKPTLAARLFQSLKQMLNKPKQTTNKEPLFKAAVDLTNFIVRHTKPSASTAYADTVFREVWFYARLGLLRSPELMSKGATFSLAQIECVLEGLSGKLTANELKVEIEAYRNDSNAHTVDTLLESVDVQFKPSNFEFFTRAQRAHAATLLVCED